jgi:hypothetical protein
MILVAVPVSVRVVAVGVDVCCPVEVAVGAVGELPPPPQAVARISASIKTVRGIAREGIGVFRFIADLNTLCKSNKGFYSFIPANTPRMYANDSRMPGKGFSASISYSKLTYPP